jgi:hypothetical protein
LPIWAMIRRLDAEWDHSSGYFTFTTTIFSASRA